METMMSKERNLAAQDRLGQLLNDHEIDRIDEVFATDVVDHDPAPHQGAGAAGIKEFWSSFHAGFPDFAIAPAVVTADDEHVTVVLDVTGTHTGEFNGIAPSGKSISVRGIQVGRFADGKIVERWGATDEAGIMKQIGAA